MKKLKEYQRKIIIYIWSVTDKDILSGQGCYNTLEGFERLMEAKNTRASISPLHVDFENKFNQII